MIGSTTMMLSALVASGPVMVSPTVEHVTHYQGRQGNGLMVSQGCEMDCEGRKISALARVGTVRPMAAQMNRNAGITDLESVTESL